MIPFRKNWTSAAAAALVLLFSLGSGAVARSFTDSAGRKIDVPARVERIFAAGPPASVLIYTLSPDKLLGWTREVSPAEREFMPQRYGDLPVTGRLTGRGNTANVEAVLAMRPDLIVDVGSLDPTYVSLADRVQAQTGIPYVLLDGAFLRTPDTYRELGELTGDRERGAELATYAEQVLTQLHQRLDAIPDDARPRVYYGRGPQGLETGLAHSINVEILDVVGAHNVAAAAGEGGLAQVAIEQVLTWNPQVVLTLDPTFYKDVRTDARWQSVDAVRDGRIYLAPSLPFGWFDSPPGVNRLIGVRWLASVLYPQAFPEDLRGITRDFYRQFYHVELDDAQLDRLLLPATGAAAAR